MRNPKALVLPFRFREGYPDEIVDAHTKMCLDLLGELELDLVKTENIIYQQDADNVIKNYNPNEIDFLILLIPTWIEPVLVVRIISRFEGKPVIVWGAGTFLYKGKRTNLGSIPGSGVVKGTLREHGVYHEYIYSLPGDDKINASIKKRIWRLANVSRAISLLDESRIVTIGYLFGGMSLGDMDITRMKKVFGPEMIEFDTYTLLDRMKGIDLSSENFKSNVKEIELTLGAPLGHKMDDVARMYTILKAIVEENNAQAITVKCNYELSQVYGLTACIPLSVLGNNVVSSCEADIPILLTQLILHYLSEGLPTTYADIHEILSDRILVGACGFAPGALCIDNKVIPDMLNDNPEGLGATFGDYISNKNYLKKGKVTLARVLKDPDGGFTLHIAAGDALGDIGKLSEIGCPQYPFTEIKLSSNIDNFAQHMGSHHYAIAYKDLAEDLNLFCKIKDLRLISEAE